MLVHISSESQPGVKVNSLTGRGKMSNVSASEPLMWLSSDNCKTCKPIQHEEKVFKTGILEEFSVLKPCENSKFGGKNLTQEQHAHSSQDDVMAPLQTILDMTASNPPFTCSLASRRWAEERIQSIDLTSTSPLFRCSTWNGADSVVGHFNGLNSCLDFSS